MAVKLDPACWLCKKDSGFRNQVHEETSPYLLLGVQDQPLDAEQDQLPCWSTGTSSGNWQEAETCMVQACQVPRQHLQNHPSGHLWGWTMLWSAEEMLGGQHQRVDISAHARTVPNGLLKGRLAEGLCWIVPHVFPKIQSVKTLNWTEFSKT